MAYAPDSGHAEGLVHECLETPEGIYCAKCACYYRDMGDYLICHGLECHRGSLDIEPVY